MGGSSSSPVSSHKRPPWKLSLNRANTTISSLEVHYSYIQFCLNIYNSVNIDINKFLLLSRIEVILQTCQKCKFEEFKNILVNNITKNMRLFSSEINRNNKSDLALEYWKISLKDFENSKNRLNNMAHIVKHDCCLKRWKDKHE